MTLREIIARNLDLVRSRMQRACQRAERVVEGVHLVAVTKYAPLIAIQELVSLGVRQLGENRPQQLCERAQQVLGAEWHLIGHLQRNKVRSVLPVVKLIHSVDSLRLLQRIDELADETGCRPQVLLEVNVSGEEAKNGFSVAELNAAWGGIVQCSRVDVQGLMTMAPFNEDPESARPVFRHLRQLRDELEQRGGRSLPELSMGMSGDFEVAIEEGATLIRLGSVLFEGTESANQGNS